MTATESKATLNRAEAAMQKVAGIRKGVAGCECASEGAGKEVLTAKAVACWERGGEPTAPLPGRNKGWREEDICMDSCGSCSAVVLSSTAAPAAAA